MNLLRFIAGCAGRAFLCFLPGALGLLSAQTPAFANGDSTNVRTDTTANIPPKIIVVATPLSSLGEKTLLPVSTLSNAEMERTGAVQIGEALVYMPGVFIRDYGGLGGLKTVSLRGATASQTAVFVDGVKVNSVQNGLADLSVFPTGMVESVEVVRGGESALFGSSAVGGAINIRSMQPQGISRVQLSASAASFGEFGAGGMVRFPVDSSMVLIGGDYRTSRGNYPFEFSEFGASRSIRRENGDFSNLSGVLAWSALYSGWNWRAHVLGRSTKRGVPGAVVQGNIESKDARLEEADILAIVHAMRELDTSLALSITGTGRYNTMRYRDPDAAIFGAAGVDEVFRTREAGLTAGLQGMAFSQSYEATADATLAELRGNMFQPGVGDGVERSSLGFSLRTERAVEVGQNSLLLQAAARLDMYSDAGTAVSPLAALLWRFGGVPVLLRAQWSYNFRPPSFNELYYLNFGTSDLKPERSQSLNAGAEWEITGGVRVEASLFSIDTKDRIVALPVSPVTWSARNIEGVVSRGVELSAHFSLFGNSVQVDGSYTRQESEGYTNNPAIDGKAIAYTPRELAALTAFVRRGWLQAGATVHGTGRRYSIDGESTDALLPAYAVAGAMVGAKFSIWNAALEVRLHCDNLFDTRYSVVRNYPMPGRMFRLSAGVVY